MLARDRNVRILLFSFYLFSRKVILKNHDNNLYLPFFLSKNFQPSYEDYDDYDGNEAEEDDEQEEDPKPTKEVLDFLKLRDQFKEKIRQKYRKENAKTLGPNHSRDKNGKPSSNE